MQLIINQLFAKRNTLILAFLVTFTQTLHAFNPCPWDILRQAFIQARATAPLNHPWNIDGVWGARGYDNVFQPFFKERGIEGLLTERKRNGKTAHVADLFGSGVFIHEEESIDSVTGVRLELYYDTKGMPRNPKDVMPAPLTRNHWCELAGNLHERSTWNLVDGSMRTRHIPAFDMIFIRPGGGGSTDDYSMEGATALAFLLLQRGYQRLTANDGMIFIHLQNPLPLPPIWLKSLEESGIKVEYRNSPYKILKLTKTPQSPPRLPHL